MLTRDQIKSNIDALEKQGASQQDVQSWLDSLKTSSPQQSMQQPTPQKEPGFFQGLIQGAASPFLRTAATAGGLITGAGATAVGLGARVLGDEKTEADAKKVAQTALSGKPVDFGYFGKVSPVGYTPEGKEKTGAEYFKDVAGTGLELGSYFMGGGAAKEVVKGAAKKSIFQLAKEGTKEGAKFGAVAGTGIKLQEEGSTLGQVAGAGALGALGGAAIGGAIGGGVPLLFRATKGTAKAVRRLVSPEAVDAATRAIKPGKNNTYFTRDFESSAPFIKNTLKEQGVDLEKMTINELDDAIMKSKGKVWDAYEQMLGPNQKAVIDGNPIADAIAGSIDKRTALQNPSLMNRILEVADTYRRKMSVKEAEEFLQKVNAELESYYAKNKVGRKTASQDPTVSYLLNESEGLRTQLYAKLNELTGGNANELKALYGSLSNVGKEVSGRANVYNRQQPASLQETIHYPLAVARGVLSVARGDVAGAGESLLQIGVSRALKERNSTDGLLRAAFKKVGDYKGPLPIGNQAAAGAARLRLPAPKPLGSAENPILTQPPTTYEKQAPLIIKATEKNKAPTSQSDLMYKNGQHLTEIENENLTTAELKRKLVALKEGNDDPILIKQVEKEIKMRQQSGKITAGKLIGGGVLGVLGAGGLAVLESQKVGESNKKQKEQLDVLLKKISESKTIDEVNSFGNDLSQAKDEETKKKINDALVRAYERLNSK